MSRPIKVMHFADTHFGVELYGRIDPDTGLNTRLKDFKQSLLYAIDYALEANIDLAVFAGDAYKVRDPRQTDQREFADCIRRLTERNIPVALLVGNHDMPAIRGRANAVEIYRTLGVSRVHVIARPEMILIPTAGGTVRVVGLPYLMKGFSVARDEFQGKSLEEARRMLEEKYASYLHFFAQDIRQANDAIPSILLGHFWANGAKLSTWQSGYFTRDEPQVSLASLADPAFDYVALGHIHKHQDLNPHAQPHVVYSGSPDRIDFGEREETKGFVMVSLSKGGAEYEFVPVPESRPFLEIEIDADCDTPTEKIVATIKKYALRNAIVKLSYQISAERQHLVREREIRDALAPAFMTVAIQRKTHRTAEMRGREFAESKTPRENLEAYLRHNDAMRPHSERLLELSEALFRDIAEEDAS